MVCVPINSKRVSLICSQVDSKITDLTFRVFEIWQKLSFFEKTGFEPLNIVTFF